MVQINYMISKKPIIGMIDGEAYNIIKLAKCGLVCKSGDFKKLSENIRKFINYTDIKKRKMGLNGFDYSNKYFNRIKQLKKGNFYLRQLSSINFVPSKLE